MFNFIDRKSHREQTSFCENWPKQISKNFNRNFFIPEEFEGFTSMLWLILSSS